MVKYRVTFIYGSWQLWADIERSRISKTDRRGFADLADLAVHTALSEIIGIEHKHCAHDYVIFELSENSSSELQAQIAYAFDTLDNE